MLTRYQTEFDFYIRLELAGTLRCPPGWRGDRHRHAFWEILYITSGECDVCIGDRVWHLDADGALLVGPMEDHRLLAGSKETFLTYVGFRCETGRGLPEERLISEQKDGFGELMRIMREMAEVTDFRSCGVRLVHALLPVAKWLKSLNGEV